MAAPSSTDPLSSRLHTMLRTHFEGCRILQYLLDAAVPGPPGPVGRTQVAVKRGALQGEKGAARSRLVRFPSTQRGKGTFMARA